MQSFHACSRPPPPARSPAPRPPPPPPPPPPPRPEAPPCARRGGLWGSPFLGGAEFPRGAPGSGGPGAGPAAHAAGGGPGPGRVPPAGGLAPGRPGGARPGARGEGPRAESMAGGAREPGRAGLAHRRSSEAARRGFGVSGCAPRPGAEPPGRVVRGLSPRGRDAERGREPTGGPGGEGADSGFSSCSPAAGCRRRACALHGFYSGASATSHRPLLWPCAGAPGARRTSPGLPLYAPLPPAGGPRTDTRPGHAIRLQPAVPSCTVWRPSRGPLGCVLLCLGCRTRAAGPRNGRATHQAGSGSPFSFAPPPFIFCDSLPRPWVPPLGPSPWRDRQRPAKGSGERAG